MGVGTWGDYHDGIVRFSDGSTEYLRIDPDSGPLLGVQFAHYFTGKLAGYVGVSYASPDAEYVERGNLRPAIDLPTTEIDLGALYDVRVFGAAGKPSALGVGGGISLVRHQTEGSRWDGFAVNASTTSLGVHGLGALDVGLSALLALRVQLELGVLPLRLGDLERELAFAEGEIGADAQSDNMTYAELAVGSTFRF